MNQTILRQKFVGRQTTSTERINRIGKASWLSESAKPAEFRDAAVLIPIFEGPEEFEVLLTRRATHLKHHPGQVSFPGGRHESDDSDLVATALRETWEETGVASNFVEVIGHLPRMYTISYYDVDPVVGLMHPGYELIPDTSEVERIFSVPLSFLSSSENQLWTEREFEGHKMDMVEFHFDNERIWGATAALILTLVDLIWNADP